MALEHITEGMTGALAADTIYNNDVYLEGLIVPPQIQTEAAISKNLFDKTGIVPNYYINDADGTYNGPLDPSVKIAVSPLIDVLGLSNITVSGNDALPTSGVTGAAYQFLDVANVIIGYGHITTFPAAGTLAVPLGARYFRYNVRYGNDDLDYYDTIQVEAGEVATAYEPFDLQVLIGLFGYPIKYPKYTLIETTGNNLFDKTAIAANYYIDTGSGTYNGPLDPSYKIAASPLILVEGLDNITISGQAALITGGGSSSYQFLDASSTLLTHGVISTLPGASSLTVPPGAKYFRYNVRYGNDDLDYYDIIQVEPGTEATAYQPYGTTDRINSIDGYRLYSGLSDSDAQYSPFRGKIGATYGDSITAEVHGGGSWPDGIYYNKLKNKLQLASITKHGHSGYCIGTGGAGTLADSALLDDLLGSGAALYMLLFGTNDFGNSVALGNYSTPANIAAAATTTTTGGLRYILAYMKTNSILSTLIVCTPLPRTDQFTANGGGLFLQDYVDCIKAVCRYYSVPVLDLYATSGISWEQNPTTFFIDGVHPNDTGYNRMTDIQANFAKLQITA